MNDGIGQQLRQARAARDLTLEQVAQATHVRVHYLRALESGDYEAIPSMAQARGFLRIYSDFLGLKPADLLSQLSDTAPPPPSADAVAQAASPATPTGAGVAPGAPAGTEILKDIGIQLVQRRQLLGLSLADVEKHTHLRSRYLAALEAGDLEGLPSPVQGRGMLNNYAEFLGMDPEPLMLRFAEMLQTQLAMRQARPYPAPQTIEPRVPASPSLLRRIFSSEMLLIGVVVVFLGIFTLWATIRIFNLRSQQEPTPTAPGIASILLSPPTETPTPTQPAPTPTQFSTLPVPAGLESTGTPQATPLPGTENQIRVYLTVRQRAWLRVTVDGDIEFEGRVLPGSAYQYVGEETVEVLTSNGAGVQIFFNQQDLGAMGFYGEVVSAIFTLEGIQTPTPFPTMTPTRTPRVTPTPLGATNP